MTSTTGTSIDGYIEWLKRELVNKDYGEVSLQFKVCKGQVVFVSKESKDTEQIPLKH